MLMKKLNGKIDHMFILSLTAAVTQNVININEIIACSRKFMPGYRIL